MRLPGWGCSLRRLLVVQDKETRDLLSRLNAKYFPGAGDDMDPFYGAPTVLVVLASKERPTCVEDGSLVMGNLMNAAYAVGVGSCWIHRAREVFDSEEGKELLKNGGLKGTMWAWATVSSDILPEIFRRQNRVKMIMSYM